MRKFSIVVTRGMWDGTEHAEVFKLLLEAFGEYDHCEFISPPYIRIYPKGAPQMKEVLGGLPSKSWVYYRGLIHFREDTTPYRIL